MSAKTRVDMQTINTASWKKLASDVCGILKNDSSVYFLYDENYPKNFELFISKYNANNKKSQLAADQSATSIIINY